MIKARCPVCDQQFEGEKADLPYLPFCSDRCRLIDLGKWASGGYVISTPITDPEQLENMAEEQARKPSDGEEATQRKQ